MTWTQNTKCDLQWDPSANQIKGAWGAIHAATSQFQEVTWITALDHRIGSPTNDNQPTIFIGCSIVCLASINRQ